MIRLLLLFAIAFQFSCDSHPKPSPANLVENQILMIPVNSAGKQFKVINNSNSSIKFSYNYSISQTEITKAQWSEILELPKPMSDSADYPITDVSWYEVALFANQLSKLSGMDTVYKYDSISRLINGEITNLHNLKPDYTIRGYRLPSEAEWLFAATLGSSDKYLWGPDSADATNNGWFSENSNGELHPVAQKVGLHGLYDMCGNALEWTTNSFGEIPNGTIVDYFGAIEDSNTTERVVKGSSFTFPSNECTAERRRSIYPSLSSAHFPYLGFRLVLGNTSKPSISIPNRPESLVQISASLSEISAFLDNAHFRYTFVLESTNELVLLEGSPYGINVNKYSLGVAIKHPKFSPDGKRIAFSTYGEGQNSQGDVYIFTPSQNSLVLVATGAIPRWHVTNHDTSLVYVTRASNNRIVSNISQDTNWNSIQTIQTTILNGIPATSKILSQGGFHSGISLDGTWIATSSLQLRTKNLVSGEIIIPFAKGLDGKQSGFPQVCNTSMSSEASPRIAFLDFGSQTTSNITGNVYGIHEYIFISDIEGQHVSFIHAPEGAKGFAHPEWSNNKNYIATNLIDSSENYSVTGILNVSTKAFFPLLDSGLSMIHPDIWVGSPLQILSDSLANYANPAMGSAILEFSTKLPFFFEWKDEIEVAIVGTSRPDQGVNSERIDWPAINLSFPASLLSMHARAIQGYILPHCPQLKAIILSIEPEYLASFSANRRVFFSSHGLAYDSLHNFWSQGIPDDLLIATRTRPRLEHYDFFRKHRGYKYTEANEGWASDTVSFAIADPNQDSLYAAINYFESLITEITDRGIYVIGVVFPLSPVYKNSSLYSSNGVRDQVVDGIFERIKAVQTTNPRFVFMDENQFGAHDYNNSEAQNADHLNATGAIKMTARINAKLHQLLP